MESNEEEEEEEEEEKARLLQVAKRNLRKNANHQKKNQHRKPKQKNA